MTDTDKLREALKAARDYIELDARNRKYPLAIEVITVIDAALSSVSETTLDSPEADARRQTPLYDLLQRLDQFLHRIADDAGPSFSNEARQLHAEVHEQCYRYVAGRAALSSVSETEGNGPRSIFKEPEHQFNPLDAGFTLEDVESEPSPSDLSPTEQAEPRHWPDPTPEMLNNPIFNQIWNVIKTWDVNVPAAYGGYCGANGNHVRAIFDAIAPAAGAVKREAVLKRFEDRPDNQSDGGVESRHATPSSVADWETGRGESSDSVDRSRHSPVGIQRSNSEAGVAPGPSDPSPTEQAEPVAWQWHSSEGWLSLGADVDPMKYLLAGYEIRKARKEAAPAAGAVEREAVLKRFEDRPDDFQDGWIKLNAAERAILKAALRPPVQSAPEGDHS